MSKRNLNFIKNELKSVGSRIESYRSLSWSEIKKSMLILESIFSDSTFSLKEQEELIEFSKKNNLLSLFQKAYEQYEANLEKEFALSFVKGKNNQIRKYHFYDGYFNSVKKVARLAKIEHNDKVSFIGSGPMPMTAILLHELTGANIDCFETNRQSAELSKKVIQKLTYDQYIKVINKNALSAKFSSYTVIILAVLAKPKYNLMKIIWKRILPGTKIIYRLPSITRQAYYEDTSDVLNTYRRFEKKRITGRRTSTLVLLVKN